MSLPLLDFLEDDTSLSLLDLLKALVAEFKSDTISINVFLTMIPSEASLGQPQRMGTSGALLSEAYPS